VAAQRSGVEEKVSEVLSHSFHSPQIFKPNFPHQDSVDSSELRQEVQESLEGGYSLEEIRQAMIDDGYSPEVVDDLLSEFKDSGRTGDETREDFRSEERQKDSSSEGIDEDASGPQEGSEEPMKTEKIQGKTRGPARVVLFSIITFGIYFFYWEYLMMKYGLTTRMEPGKARLAALGLWFVTAIPLVNLAVWAYFFREILKASPVDKELNKYTAIYIVLMLTGIGLFVTQYMVQKDVNAALED
jgi:cytochrome c-type biogenesis protein CcmH/NrfF